MKKEEMKYQLEKLEKTRKEYFYEYQITREMLDELSPAIRPFLTIGGLDGFGIGNAEEMLSDIEKQMEKQGIEWDKEPDREIDL